MYIYDLSGRALKQTPDKGVFFQDRKKYIK